MEKRAKPFFVDPGLLRTKAVLEAPRAVSDGQGGARIDWTAVRGVSIHVAPRSAVRRERFDRAEGEVRHRVLCRRSADVMRGARFRLGGRILTIETVYDPDQRGRFLLCLCKEEME